MNIIKMPIIVLISMLFIGCSGTPEETVAKMYDALKDGEVSKLHKVTSESKARDLTVEALSKCSIDKASYKQDSKDCFKEMYGNISVKSIEITKAYDNEVFVSVVYENYSNTITNKEFLRKKDGKWVVFIYNK